MNIEVIPCEATTRSLPARTARLLATLLAMGCVIALLCASAQAAEGERVLDPQLSLIGGCKEEALDSVQDPGCPTIHPPSTFSDPRAVATDEYGNIYVSSFGSSLNGSKGRIDVFCSDGTFVSELSTPGPTSLAVDSKGHLYVFSTSEKKVLHFVPSAPYQPEACNIEYGSAPVLVKETGSFYGGLAINRDNDHLFVDFGQVVVEYNSAEEGNGEVRTSPGPSWGGGNGMAVDAAHDRMYASAGLSEERVDIFDLNSVVGAPPGEYKNIGSIKPSSVPAGDFGTQLSIAVDEGNGHVFVLDGENCHLYEFEEDGNYLTTIEFPLECTRAEEIGVDNGPLSPNGALSDKGRYLYVPSSPKGIGHSFAFFESTEGPPEIKSTATANVSEGEAELQAQINPNNLPTTYAFELKAEGAPGWTPVGEGAIAASNLDAEASAAASGLAPGTSYRFRVVGTNEAGSGEAEGSFATYPSVATETSLCPNALLRGGSSALLPDCRAYELVTPPDTNAHAPVGPSGTGGGLTTRQVSPTGDKVPFRVEGGSLPDLGGTGSLVGDPYLATRTPAGWSTSYPGPSGDETTQVVPGTSSPDQGYSFWIAGDKGSAVLAPNTAYVRYPDGHSELLGEGSLGIDPQPTGQLISEGGGHIVFSTGVISAAVQLEPEAAPDGTGAVYDRTADGITHVVSLKPGDVPFGAHEDAVFQGVSPDGVGIAFKANNTLYLRHNDEETFEIGTGVNFAGVSEGGGRIFYMKEGNLEAFDVASEETITFADTIAAVVPVTVAADGSAAYFVSDSAIAESGLNPQGEEPQPGEQNLYLSREGQIEFVSTVTDRDVEGVFDGNETVDGLGRWLNAIVSGRLSRVPARSTPDGSVFLFKSRAALTNYDSEGYAEIYRYDSVADELQCLSCDPIGVPASSDSTLQSETGESSKKLFSPLAWPENLRADGRRAFFESSEALVAADTDGRQDIYEWEADGVGSCTKPGGCVYLISSPHSTRNEYLWAVSESGDDVFVLSGDLLLPADADATLSIYDARALGGFPEPNPPAECLGEACQPSVSAPGDPTPGLQGRGGNIKEKPKARSCAKGRRKVRRGGKVRCLKPNKHHRAAAKRKGGHR